MQHHTGTCLCHTNTQPHPSTIAHNTGGFWISDFGLQRGFHCHFGCFVCAALPFWQKKKPKKPSHVQNPRMIFFPRSGGGGAHVHVYVRCY
jgi:hypothetical protein